MSATSEWLAVARITNDPEGDLIADMRTDRDIPGLFGNLKAMHDYVSFKSRGDPKILAAVPGVWRRYRRWVDRHPFRQRS
jgi:hypothetical protein